MDALGATKNEGDIPDGQFLAWLGQFQWARRLGWKDTQLIGRGDLQLSDSPLLGLEQFAVGGHGTVRGYRENQLVRDNGVVGSIEARVPIWKASDGRPILELVPFFDAAYSRNRKRPTIGPRTLISAGLGSRLDLGHGIRFEIYWGHPFPLLGPQNSHDYRI